MIVKGIAPARILDFGGWTDTWFAKHGRVLNFAVDLYAKVAIALVSLVMSLIGVSFGLRTGKGGAMLWVGVCIPMGFLYWMLLSMGFSLGRGGVLPPLVAAWLPNLVFGLGGLLSLWRLRG